jgi:hypothetical protein
MRDSRTGRDVEPARALVGRYFIEVGVESRFSATVRSA